MNNDELKAVILQKIKYYESYGYLFDKIYTTNDSYEEILSAYKLKKDQIYDDYVKNKIIELNKLFSELDDVLKTCFLIKTVVYDIFLNENLFKKIKEFDEKLYEKIQELIIINDIR
jgi:hypothetical protein